MNLKITNYGMHWKRFDDDTPLNLFYVILLSRYISSKLLQSLRMGCKQKCLKVVLTLVWVRDS